MHEPSKPLLSTRIWAAVRTAGGDVSVAARALGLPPREVLQLLLENPAPDGNDSNSAHSGTRRRLLIDPIEPRQSVPGSRPHSSAPPAGPSEPGEPRAWETPAWEDDEDDDAGDEKR